MNTMDDYGEVEITNGFEQTVKFTSHGALCCKCGCQNLHQGAVTLFDRIEDDPLVLVTEATGGDTSMGFKHNATSGNPSLRRHGLIIHTECESGCQEKLAIYQHKGDTYMGWV